MYWPYSTDLARPPANPDCMEAAMRGHDWARSAVGPVEAWPATLKCAVRMLLDCQLPMYLAWGPQHVQFFNDAYVPILGDKKEGALGNSASLTWSEIWPTIGPMWADVLRGEPIGAEDFRLTIDRFGYAEDCYFNFSYSPVPDETGAPAGVLVTFAETTKKVLAERRQAFQLQLADTLRDQSGGAALVGAAARLSGHYFGVDRVGYADIDDANGTVFVERDWTMEGFVSLAGESRPLDSFGPLLIDELRAGRTLVIDDVAADARSQPYVDGYASIGVCSITAVPLREDKILKGIFFLHVGTPRHWLAAEVTLVEDVARRIADAVGRLRAEEMLRDESSVLELLNQTGLSLNSTLRIDELLQSITDAATKLAGAQFGSFFYNGRDAKGDALMLYTLSGAPREAFEGLGHPRATPVFSPTFHGRPTVRSDNITLDPRYGQMAPVHGMPQGHLPVVSYMATPVVSKSGEVLGGLFFGHPEAGKFTARTERIIEGIAAQAAIAMDNAILYEAAHNAARERDVLLASERGARAEAERLNRSKDEFLAMLAHELRNPLAPVVAAAEILKLTKAGGPEVARASDVISRQVRHLTLLINDLMDVSRVTRGLVELNQERVSIKSIAELAVEQARPLIARREHTLSISFDDEQATICGDRTRLVQVVSNLLNNAAKYTAPGGAIALRIAADAEQIVIEVADNGAGIEPGLLPHVFELFTQGARSLDRPQGGLGIGLALARAIVALHGGTIEASSAGPRQGSQFTVRLPRAPGAQQEAAPGAVPAGAPVRILLVDDNVDAAESLGVLLQAIGHEVQVVFSATAALEAAAARPPDAFILDIGLPDMSGYELAVAVRAIDACRRATLIALTGYGQAQDREAARAAGFDHHFAKPADVQRLVKVLADMARSAPALPQQ